MCIICDGCAWFTVCWRLFIRKKYWAARMFCGLFAIAALNSHSYTSVGEDIPENSDLNNYATPGKYKCNDAARAATLINCPVSYGFSMYVEPLGYGDWIRQTIKRAAGNEMLWRVFNPLRSIWEDWAQVALKGNYTLAPIESTVNVKALEPAAYVDTEIVASVTGEYIVLFKICPCGSKNGWFEVRLFDKTNMDAPIYLGSRSSGAISISEAWDSQYTYFCFAHLAKGKTYVARFINRSTITDGAYNATFSVIITPVRQ